MNEDADQMDAELKAMQTIYGTLVALDDDARKRVVSYVSSRLGLGAQVQNPYSKPKHGAMPSPDHDSFDESEGEEEVAEGPQKFEHLAELFDAVSPQTDQERVLVAAYWLQTSTGAASVDGFRINKELKHLGHGVGNVTRAIDALKSMKPALMIQLRKSGKTRQARKEYKVTSAGEKALHERVNEQG